MNWQKLAENRIDEAIALGEFDDLPGHGQPLDLTEYFSQPASERMGVNLLKNAGVVPPEVELLKQIAALEEALAECGDAAKRGAIECGVAGEAGRSGALGGATEEAGAAVASALSVAVSDLSASAVHSFVILSGAGKHGRSRRTSNIQWVFVAEPTVAAVVASESHE